MKNLPFNEIDSAQVVSFDVFDTLIHRYVKNPVDVFDLVDLSCNTKLNNKIKGRFKDLRITAEQKAREFKRSNNKGWEVTYDEIYEQFAKLVNADISFVTKYKTKEIEFEKALCYADNDALEIYNYALSKGKKVILISDMYLPSNVIKELVEIAGIPSPEKVYVSCEYGRSKSDGELYELISKELSVDMGSIFHIGDNEHADIEMARTKGICVYHRPWPNFEIEKKLRLRKSNYEIVDSLIIGILRKILSISPAQNTGDDIALQIIGPLFVGSFLWTLNSLQEDKVEKILFFARDGYIPEKIYAQYSKCFGVNIPSSYFYASRVAIVPPSLVDFNMSHFDYVVRALGNNTVRTILLSLGLNDHEKIINKLSQFGYNDLDHVYNNHDSDFIKALATLFPDILYGSNNLRKTISEYIYKEIDGVSRIGIFDTGWHGTLQTAFSKIANTFNSKVFTCGFYLGLIDMYDFVLEQNKVSYKSYLGEIEGIVEKGGAEILEFIYAAPHGTTLGYKKEGDKILPLLEESSPAEIDYQVKAKEHQYSAMNFVSEALDLLNKLPWKDLVDKSWAHSCICMIKKPQRDEADFYGEITHSNSAGGTEKRKPIAAKVNYSFLGNLNPAYRKAKKDAYWMAGFKKRKS